MKCLGFTYAFSFCISSTMASRQNSQLRTNTNLFVVFPAEVSPAPKRYPKSCTYQTKKGLCSRFMQPGCDNMCTQHHKLTQQNPVAQAPVIVNIIIVNNESPPVAMCTAMTKKNTACTRPAHTADMCRQHFQILCGEIILKQ
jgi:hypothetical protein